MIGIAEKFERKASTRAPALQEVRLKLVGIDVWSTAKMSFVVGISLGLLSIPTTLLFWMILNQLGIFDQLDTLVSGVTTFSGNGTGGTRSMLSFGVVLNFSIIVALLNVVLAIVLGPLVALFYNVSASILGGLFIGLARN
ncbi:DUF3566 domain-containing protein [Cryobacterium sp. GrIS_2_6]|uniref:DUF3566 domain-containing protein n=1 Tax=Cryobacterium sp. GrIS_2_6 TaxID=3162785 RepID=UPI002DFC9ECE|nr:hypothetical protein [Cryobacterium psychrotolerans]